MLKVFFVQGAYLIKDKPKNKSNLKKVALILFYLFTITSAPNFELSAPSTIPFVQMV